MVIRRGTSAFRSSIIYSCFSVHFADDADLFPCTAPKAQLFQQLLDKRWSRVSGGKLGIHND